MGYAKITNLYKRPDFLDMFRKVWVLEKVHGTSAHIQFRTNELDQCCINPYSGGADSSQFNLLFDNKALVEIYKNSSIYKCLR